MGIQNVLASVY